MALSTDYALRTGAFEPAEASVNAQDLQGSCEWAGRAAWEGAASLAQGAGFRPGLECLPLAWDFLIGLLISSPLRYLATVQELKDRAQRRYDLVRVSVCWPSACLALSSSSTGPFNGADTQAPPPFAFPESL